MPDPQHEKYCPLHPGIDNDIRRSSGRLDLLEKEHLVIMTSLGISHDSTESKVLSEIFLRLRSAELKLALVPFVSGIIGSFIGSGAIVAILRFMANK